MTGVAVNRILVPEFQLLESGRRSGRNVLLRPNDPTDPLCTECPGCGDVCAGLGFRKGELLAKAIGHWIGFKNSPFPLIAQLFRERGCLCQIQMPEPIGSQKLDP